jgi:hypothetical protein
MDRMGTYNCNTINKYFYRTEIPCSYYSIFFLNVNGPELLYYVIQNMQLPLLTHLFYPL